MNTNSLRASLACLAHPATLASIGLLLLNDQFLKAAAPSWLTGKLSDFAGLFFFPFLLAALIGGLAALVHPLPARVVGPLAIVVTAAWFSAVKTVPLANSWTAGAAALLLGAPPQIVMDPTDLAALVMLWPAWRLWKRFASAPAVSHCRPALRWLALGLAAFATMATSPAPYRPPAPIVARVAVADDVIGVALRGVQPVWWELRTQDGWRTCSMTDTLSDAEKAALDQQPIRLLLSDPRDADHQFRAAGDTVEGSSDGGETWRSLWHPPTGRLAFLNRYIQTYPDSIDFGLVLPQDPHVQELAFSPDGSGALIVAAGLHGILLRDPSGKWARWGLMCEDPLPYSAISLRTWLEMLNWPEGATAILVTCLTGVILSLSGSLWHLKAVRASGKKKQAAWGTGIALAMPVVAFIVSIAALFMMYQLLPGFSSEHGEVAFLGAASIAAALLSLGWAPAIRYAPHPAPPRRALGGCLLATIAVWLGCILPFVLWAVGVVPWQVLAWFMAIGLVVVSIIFGASSLTGRPLGGRAAQHETGVSTRHPDESSSNHPGE
jgi:hypothetical protein